MRAQAAALLLSESMRMASVPGSPTRQQQHGSTSSGGSMNAHGKNRTPHESPAPNGSPDVNIGRLSLGHDERPSATPRGHISRVKAEEEDIPPRSHSVGTARFASIRGHQGQASSAVSKGRFGVAWLYDGLLCAGETALARFASALQRREARAVMEKKMATSAEQLREELPEEFAQYMQEVKDIPTGVRPHCEELRHKFRRLAVREGVRYNHVFDWTICLFSEIK
ncbi:serine/threonine protein kinase [Friedmanniomyces endolithicus]|nr:serine/threonine protein kinase [Friedmanniomyces endolithicus]